MKTTALPYLLFLLLVVIVGCREYNTDLNEGEEFRPRALMDDFDDSHFTKVTVDGVEYIMMERDNNNPHEGFGFMAFRANKMIEKQDTIISYLRTMQEYQQKMYAKMFGLTEEAAQAEFNQTFEFYLREENKELLELEKEELINAGN